jgi:hypothetical protein
MNSPLVASILMLAGGLLGFSLLALGAVLVHEAGHAAAAVLLGFRVMAVRVGPIQIKRPKSWNWTLSRNDLLTGFVQVQFRKIPGRWAKWQCFAFLLAGPSANIGPALVTAPLLRGDSVAANIGSLFMLVSALVGAANLIPSRIRGKESDGAKVCQLLFTRKKRDEFLFRCSLICRIEEVLALYKARQFQQASSKAEELVKNCAAIPSLESNAGLMQRLIGLRDSLQKHSPDTQESKHLAPTSQA